MIMLFHLMSCFESGWAKTCCHRRASEVWLDATASSGLDGFVRITGDDEDGSAVIVDVIVILRRFPNVVSSRGGVFIGECLVRDPRWGFGVSSSRLRTPDRRLLDGLPAIDIGVGERRLCGGIWVGTAVVGVGCDPIGGRVAKGDGGIGLATPATDMTDVCGWLGPLRVNVLHSQEGVNLLDAFWLGRGIGIRPLLSAAVEEVAPDPVDVVERVERTEDREGDWLNCL